MRGDKKPIIERERKILAFLTEIAKKRLILSGREKKKRKMEDIRPKSCIVVDDQFVRSPLGLVKFVSFFHFRFLN